MSIIYFLVAVFALALLTTSIEIFKWRRTIKPGDRVLIRGEGDTIWSILNIDQDTGAYVMGYKGNRFIQFTCPLEKIFPVK